MDNIIDDLIMVEDVMEQLNIGKNTVYALLKDQQIDAFRIERIWKIPQQSLNEFIRKNAERKSHFQLIK